MRILEHCITKRLDGNVKMRRNSPKNKNSVINYSSCCSKSINVHSSLEHKLRYFDEIQAFWPYMDSKGTTTFKAQKCSKDIMKIVMWHQWFNLSFTKIQVYFFVQRKLKYWLYSTIYPLPCHYPSPLLCFCALICCSSLAVCKRSENSEGQISSKICPFMFCRWTLFQGVHVWFYEPVNVYSWSNKIWSLEILTWCPLLEFL